MKNRHNVTMLRAILPVLAYFGLLPQVKAVSPPPDGCYPNLTTAEGCDALHSLTTGEGNTAIGWSSLFSDADGSFNTGIGGGALALNNGDSNTAVGVATLLLNTADGNTAVGASALLNNTTGGTLGGSGVNTVGPNTALGNQALLSNTEAGANTAMGYKALGSVTTAGFNTAVGFQAVANSTALSNTAFGYGSLQADTTGGFNTSIGDTALYTNTTGEDNVALGFRAGFQQTTGNNNIYIGNQVEGVAGESNSCYIGNIYGSTSVGAPVLVDSNGKLGTQTSSKRFKDDIKPMDKASEEIFQLQPVTFHYKKKFDPAGTQQFGLVAEDVQKVNPALVVPDKEGKPYSVRYGAVNAMLLNEFLKEHKTVQELKSTVRKDEAVIAQQQKSFQDKLGAQAKQIDILTAGLQNVSAQLELSKSAPRTVSNNQ
jgi:hypothetical protein